MANFFTNAIDITPSTSNVWVDIDVSSYCPAGTTGVIIQIFNPSSVNVNWGLRKKGSTDNRITGAYQTTQKWGYIGVDNARVLQGFSAEVSYLKFKLLGYFTSDGVFFTNGYDKEPATLNSWVDINCSSEIPSGAKFAVIELTNANSSHGLRPVGSTDNRSRYVFSHGFALVGLNSSRFFQYYKTYDDATLHLVGYLTSGNFKINGVDVSLSSTGSYVNIDRSGDSDSAGATGVIVEVYASSNYRNYSLRKNGSTDDFYKSEYHAWGAVGLDDNRTFQGKISVTDLDFYVLGYLTLPPQTWEYVGNIVVNITPQSEYAFPRTFIYNGDITLTLNPQSDSIFPINKTYDGNILFSLSPQSSYHPEWGYNGNIQLLLLPGSSTLWLLGREFVGNIQLSLVPQSNYLSVLGRQAIPIYYLLRYPTPSNGQTNVPINGKISFILKSDTNDIDITKVNVTIKDSYGTNIYNSASPYFKSIIGVGGPSKYTIDVKPPQSWTYEESVRVDIDSEKELVYEYVP